MSTIPHRQHFTLQEYLAREDVSEDKHEYYSGDVFLMPGGSPRHSRIIRNILGQLYLQLRGKPCEPFGSDQRIAVKKYSLHTYPDISIICGKLIVDSADIHAATNPHTLFEVLSPSTERYNRGLKFEFYRAIPTLREYILVSQDRPHVERFVWQPKGKWLMSDYDGLESVLELSDVGCKLALSDVYEAIDFDPIRLVTTEPEPKSD